jgi:hypothetical protein
MEWANGTSETSLLSIDEYLDEVLKESFPASDPPSSWSGRDRRESDRGENLQQDEVADPMPGADDDRVAVAGDESDPREGRAPTG